MDGLQRVGERRRVRWRRRVPGHRGVWGQRPVRGRRPPVREEIDLGSRVQRSDLQLQITNLNSFAWTDCEIILNAGILRSGFSQQVGPIEAGEAVEWLLVDFTRPSGERFDPLAVVVTDVILTCNTARGPGVHYAAF